MGELIQHFSSLDIHANETTKKIDIELVKRAVERSREAATNVKKHAHAGFWERLTNLYSQNDKKAFSDAIQALGELSQIQLAFTMLGVDLSNEILAIQKKFNTHQSDVRSNISVILNDLQEQYESIVDIDKTLSSLNDKHKTNLSRMDSIESMLMDVIGADAALRDYEAVNKVRKLLNDALSEQKNIKEFHEIILHDMNMISNEVKSTLQKYNEENHILHHKTEANIREKINNLDAKNSRSIIESKEILDKRISDTKKEIYQEISALNARSSDRMSVLSASISDTSKRLTKLILQKKQESDDTMHKYFDQLDASRKNMGQVILHKMQNHVRTLIEKDKILENKITDNAISSTNEFIIIKAELARVQIWAKLTTSFALIATGWIIYSSLFH